MKYKIEFDWDKCIGCESCCSICDNWQMKGAKAAPKQTELEEIGCNKEAEQYCPVGAIKILKNE
ncbi:MAG: ferredoxin [Candidatus Micrarchaeota archaeon]